MDGFYEQIDQVESLSGVRLPWTVFPSTKNNAKNLPIPVSAFYTPMKDVDGLLLAKTRPCICLKCGAYLNPFCAGDLQQRRWICQFCNTGNSLPEEIVQNPSVLDAKHMTCEYVLGNNAHTPFYLFIIDTNQPLNILDQLKTTILRTLDYMPPEAQIGLITYSENVLLWDLQSEGLPRSYVFDGEEIPSDGDFEGTLRSLFDIAQSFIRPVGDCVFAFSELLDAVFRSVPSSQLGNYCRSCAGVALGIAHKIVEKLCHGQTGRVLLFNANPITHGKGLFAEIDKRKTLRTHLDLKEHNAPHTKSSRNFFRQLADKFCDIGVSVDVWSASVRQTGVYEMVEVFERTGGHCFMCDRFTDDIFTSSLLKSFARAGGIGHSGLYEDVEAQSIVGIPCVFNAKIKVQTPPYIVFKGLVDNREPTEKDGNEFFVGQLTPNSTFAFVFDIDESLGTQNFSARPYRYIQFTTQYTHPNGKMVLRVTTIAVNWNVSNNMNELVKGFDQEAAAVLLARMATKIMRETAEHDEARIYVDRTVVDLCSLFSSYTINVPSSVTFPQTMTNFPQFSFYLRRNVLLSNFNESPDETTYKRYIFERCTVNDSLVIIQPTLTKYSMDSTESVLLDISSLQRECLLVLDTYYTVLLHYDEEFKNWRAMNYHEEEGFSWFGDLIASADEHARSILNERWPTPVLHFTHPNHSQMRFLKSILNPPSLAVRGQTRPTGNSQNMPFTSKGNPLKTSDVSYSDFMESLRGLITKP
ncbi:hypothetical protein PCE1_003669 [Barthelona sp. PCE]